ncbi:MAG TPA: glycosyltransferase, partial [Hyphomicrobium sp.]|nr:glycosyltransferase [Hyphomicrobium sp.]
EFVLVGGCSLPDGWCTLPNVKLLGRKPYEIVASYMAAMDVLIMPWNDSAWIKACNPIKLKEYLAVGRPIVSKDFPALDKYRDLVRTAENARDFSAAIQAALDERYDPAPARKRLASEGWDAKAAYLAECLVDLVYEVQGRKLGGARAKRSAA